MKISNLLLAGLLFSVSAHADLQATTKDGREVLLRDNGLWEFVVDRKQEQQPKALLKLEKREDIPNGCRLGLRVDNQLNAQIRTLVLRFTAYKPGGIPFETVSRGYSFIKPTKNQYQEIRFRDLSCDDIDKVQVRAAHNCHVGELTKYSATEESCLSLVKVVESNLMTIYIAPSESAQR